MATRFASLVAAIGVLLPLGNHVGIAAAAEGITPADVIEIEKSLIESRRSIRSGRVVIAVRYNTFSQDPTQTKNTKRYEIYFEGDRVRVDLAMSSSAGKSYSQEILTEDTFIRADSSDQWVQLFGPETKPESATGLPNPRLLGLVAWHFDTISQFGFEAHFLQSDRDDVRVEAIEDGHRRELKVAYQYEVAASRVNTEYTLDLERDNLPVHIAVSSGEGQERQVQSINCKWTHHDDSGVYYPQEVVFRYWHGDKLLAEEVTAVEEAEIEKDIDDKMFTLAGMGLAEDQVVSNDGKLMIWTGKKLVPKSLQQKRYQGDEFVAGDTGGSRRWLLIVNAIVLAAVAAVLLLGMRRKRLGLRPASGEQGKADH